MRIEPSVAYQDRYELTPSHQIGIVQLADLAIEITPKIPMSSVVFLVSYIVDQVNWSSHETDWKDDTLLVDIVAKVLCRSVEKATRRGLLHGYKVHQESTPALRGRIDFQEHLRKHHGNAPPIAVRYDIFSADIIENRLLLSAFKALACLPLRSNSVANEIMRAMRLLGGVQLEHFPRFHVPDPPITQLNRHYEPAIRIARLILQSASVDPGYGSNQSGAFLINMNTVFESFVRIALRESLRFKTNSFPESPPALHLDTAKRMALEPDLCVVNKGVLQWIGDAKYKRLTMAGYKNADIYQMLSYLTATQLTSGTLIYAADAGLESVTHTIANTDLEVRVRTLDLSQHPRLILRQISSIAQEINVPHQICL